MLLWRLVSSLSFLYIYFMHWLFDYCSIFLICIHKMLFWHLFAFLIYLSAYRLVYCHWSVAIFLPFQMLSFILVCRLPVLILILLSREFEMASVNAVFSVCVYAFILAIASDGTNKMCWQPADRSGIVAQQSMNEIQHKHKHRHSVIECWRQRFILRKWKK